MKKTSVGIILLTEIQSMGGLVAILQIRGEFNHEKKGPESWPGGCQISAHGKVEDPNHSPWHLAQEMYREVGEELGDDFKEAIIHDPLCRIQLLVHKDDEKEEVFTYGARISADQLGMVRLNASTGGLRLMNKEKLDAIMNLRDFDKEVGIRDRTITAMFPDEIEAVKKAFEAFAPQTAP